jgi:diguanylate cyclase (GGDEF)-like protein
MSDAVGTGTSAAGWVRRWKLWRLPAPAVWYIFAVTVAGAAALAVSGATTRWRPTDLALFGALLVSGGLSIEATRHVEGPSGTLTWDMMQVWYQTVAIVLAPFYALLAPCVLIALKQWRVMRSPWHRRVLSAAALGMPYGALSLVFHAIPLTRVGPASGGPAHALAWVALATGCGLAAMILNDSLVIPAILLADPKARLRTLLWGRETIPVYLIQLSLGSLIALAVAASPFLMILAIPSVLLQRRYLMHAQLLAAARTDPKTGLLNSAAWERLAEAELSRARRSGTPLAIALADIDHFKQVNDSWDHLIGDRVLCAIADAITGTLRDYDLCGRFGGEEFVIALPGTTLADAATIAERIRANVAALAVPVRDTPHAPKISVTISIGVTALTPDTADPAQDLTTLMAAADHALYRAKESGRNRVDLSPLNRPVRPPWTSQLRGGGLAAATAG